VLIPKVLVLILQPIPQESQRGFQVLERALIVENLEKVKLDFIKGRGCS
jgi:hypothetical protein